MKKTKIIRCDRCQRELRGELWGVLGHEGTFGHQCALEICQGRPSILREKGLAKLKTIEILTDEEIEEMGGLPF